MSFSGRIFRSSLDGPPPFLVLSAFFIIRIWQPAAEPNRVALLVGKIEEEL